MRQTFAYLDAGSGSMIIQILVGGFAAVAVSLKLFWRRVLRFLGIRKDDEQTPERAEQQPAGVAQTTSAEREPEGVEAR
jgi:hypothetical protein